MATELLIMLLLVLVGEVDIVEAPLADTIDDIDEDIVEEATPAEEDELAELEEDDGFVVVELELELEEVPSYGPGILVGSSSSPLMEEVGVSSSSLIVDVGRSSSLLMAEELELEVKEVEAIVL